uniref:PI-PLC Y-box domain-containing protein n=1 Tax=Macrostomum lignano TaxID=282301 RepID=A0A1I8FJW8_9PLAT
RLGHLGRLGRPDRNSRRRPVSASGPPTSDSLLLQFEELDFAKIVRTGARAASAPMLRPLMRPESASPGAAARPGRNESPATWAAPASLPGIEDDDLRLVGSSGKSKASSGIGSEDFCQREMPLPLTAPQARNPTASARKTSQRRTGCSPRFANSLVRDMWHQEWEFDTALPSASANCFAIHRRWLGRRPCQRDDDEESHHQRCVEDLQLEAAVHSGSRSAVRLCLRRGDRSGQRDLRPGAGLLSTELTQHQLGCVVEQPIPHWMISYGGLLGIKYILASRPRDAADLLP